MDPLGLVALARTLVDIDSTTGREGDCGRWWYSERGRPVRWCPDCYRRHRANLRRGLAFPADPLGRSRLLSAAEELSLRANRTEHVSAPIARALAKLKEG